MFCAVPCLHLSYYYYHSIYMSKYVFICIKNIFNICKQSKICRDFSIYILFEIGLLLAVVDISV